MLDSNADDSDGVKKTTPIKIRPKSDGPSTSSDPCTCTHTE